MRDCICISEAKHVGGYRISLRFNTGECGIVDLKDLVFAYPIVEPLRDITRFADFHLDPGLRLPGIAVFDVDPESLY